MAKMSNEEMLYRIMVSVGEIQSDVSQLKTDVAELKTDVAELKTGVAALNTRVTDIGITLEQNILLRLDILQELQREDIR